MKASKIYKIETKLPIFVHAKIFLTITSFIIEYSSGIVICAYSILIKKSTVCLIEDSMVSSKVYLLFIERFPVPLLLDFSV